MSGQQTAANGDGGESHPPPNEEVERVARANGWKPLDEFDRPDKWVPADVFVARQWDNPAIARNRNMVLVNRLEDLERSSNQKITGLEGKLDQAVTLLSQVTNMTRTAEARAYERARRELRDGITNAASQADVPTVTRLQNEMDELDRARPAADPPRQEQTPPPQQTPPGQQQQTRTPPEAERFFARNPWYKQDRVLTTAADAIHVEISEENPNMSLGDNLAEVERRMRSDPKFSARINGGRRTPPVNNGYDDDDADDRAGTGRATSVTPSSRGQTPRPRAGRRTFDTMPKDAKDAYERYKNLLEGKGAPFTKEEYATNYWEQFPEDGS